MSLSGHVCLVTGASRGIGKGIALQLAEHGATVYITGRTLKPTNREYIPGSLQETATEIEQRGGRCIPVQCDHAKEGDVRQLFDRISREHEGQLDILVNNAYSAFEIVSGNLKVPFWELPDNAYREINNVGLENHYLCSVLAAKLMVPRKKGLLVNISGHGGLYYTMNTPYGIGKAGCDRMAADCAVELKDYNVAFVSLWPFIVQTERAAIQRKDPEFKARIAATFGVDPDIIENSYRYGESIEYVGMCVVHLATDKNLMKKSGKIHITSDLGDHYGFRDLDGHKPFNIRRINSLLSLAPKWLSWVSAIVPDFVKIPTWILWLGGNKLY